MLCCEAASRSTGRHPAPTFMACAANGRKQEKNVSVCQCGVEVGMLLRLVVRLTARTGCCSITTAAETQHRRLSKPASSSIQCVVNRSGLHTRAGLHQLFSTHWYTSCSSLLSPAGWNQSLAIVAPLRCISMCTWRLGGWLEVSARAAAAVLWWSRTNTWLTC